MDINSVVEKMDSNLAVMAQKAEASMAAKSSATDPMAMIKVQSDINNFSTGLSLESSIMKAIKDMMMSIISKIG